MSLRKSDSLDDLTTDAVARPPRREKPKEAKTWGEMYRAWPKITFLIVINEFCERFCFYGMRTVLVYYLINILRYKGQDASRVYNLFGAFCYLSPLLGAVIADGWIGKFRNIVVFCILYALGNVVLAVAATQAPTWKLHPMIDLIGLGIIALGTGGIKPCVSPFGGDQFEKHQGKMIALFFSVFYFSINAGSTISTFTAPIFRATPCLGQETCYSLAFAVPAILMIIATVTFIIGSPWYKKPMPKTNVFKDVVVTIGSAVRNKFRSSESKPHWLDHALNNHNCQTHERCLHRQRRTGDSTACAKVRLVEDMKALCRILVMYLPLPIFWALYDQQGSSWNLQAMYMDCRLWNDFSMLPDQMQTLNAVLIMIYIPIFEGVLYPIANRCIEVTPLRKMVTGGMIAALAFIASALVQIEVNKSMPPIPARHHAYVSVMNTLPSCAVNVSAVGFEPAFVFVEPNKDSGTDRFHVKEGEVEFKFSYGATGCPTTLPESWKFEAKGDEEHNFFMLHFSEMGVLFITFSDEKPTEGIGESKTGVIAALGDNNYDGDFALCKVGAEGTSDLHPCNPHSSGDFYFFAHKYEDANEEKSDLLGKLNYVTKSGNSQRYAIVFEPKIIRPGHWKLYYMASGGQAKSRDEVEVTYAGVEWERTSPGGVYAISLSGNKEKPSILTYHITPDNGVSILWQVPQIAIITAAEILFSITGNEFSYTQASPAMKSIIGALFLLTIFAGDMVIVIFSLLTDLFTNDMAVVYFFYSGLMVAVTTVFMLLCIFYYEYANYTGVDAMSDSEDEDGDERDSVEQKRPFEGFADISVAKHDPFPSITNGSLSQRHKVFNEELQTRL